MVKHTGPEKNAVPFALLAAMASLMVIFVLAAIVTREWGFLVIGAVGFLVGLVPILSKR
jgi:1,4-dihydroxy-2-naphthoate octaprenyltransferase